MNHYIRKDRNVSSRSLSSEICLPAQEEANIADSRAPDIYTSYSRISVSPA